MSLLHPQARNVVSVLSADAIVVCGAGGPGTASEAAHALKIGKPLVLLGCPVLWVEFFQSLSRDVATVATVEECCVWLGTRLSFEGMSVAGGAPTAPA